MAVLQNAGALRQDPRLESQWYFKSSGEICALEGRGM